jgi:GNAT superfamily N-acetyltransferase
MEISLREPASGREFELYYDLRWRVLREPWTSERESGKDEHEADAVHLMAWAGEALVGVGRLHFNSPDEAQVRYMAVAPDGQGQGVGGLILAELERRARMAGAKRIVLNARERACDFYRKHDYQVVDRSGILFDAIPHWWMQKPL